MAHPGGEINSSNYEESGNEAHRTSLPPVDRENVVVIPEKHFVNENGPSSPTGCENPYLSSKNMVMASIRAGHNNG